MKINDIKITSTLSMKNKNSFIVLCGIPPNTVFQEEHMEFILTLNQVESS